MRFRPLRPATPETVALADAPSAPATMRAQVLDSVGEDAAFRSALVPTPTPVLSEVLVRIVAAGVHPVDAETRAGRGVSSAIGAFPATLGLDFSGVVVAAPFASHPFPAGTEVFGIASFPRMGGTYAEYAVVPTLALARKPASLSHAEAAAVPVAALTAWGLVVETALAHEGQRILLRGGTGGVGHFAVQFASYFGAHVTATGTAAEREWLRDLGASAVVDLATDPLPADVDVVIDLGGEEATSGAPSVSALRRGGLFLEAPPAGRRAAVEAPAGIRTSGYEVIPDGATLATIARLLDSGAVRVYVDRVFDLDDVANAHAALADGEPRGTLVVRVSED